MVIDEEESASLEEHLLWCAWCVERAEEAMHALGFLHVRVRHHGELARVEIARDDLPHALSMSMLDRITEALRPLGFVYVTLDTQGYRPGSMNDVLPVSAITSAH